MQTDPAKSNNQEGDQYGPWIRAEANAYMVVSEGNFLRKVETTRGEIFDDLDNVVIQE